MTPSVLVYRVCSTHRVFVTRPMPDGYGDEQESISETVNGDRNGINFFIARKRTFRRYPTTGTSRCHRPNARIPALSVVNTPAHVRYDDQPYATAPSSTIIHPPSSSTGTPRSARLPFTQQEPPPRAPLSTHGDVAGEARVQRRGRGRGRGRGLRQRQQPPARPRLRLLHGVRRRQGGAGAGGRVQRGAARVRAGVDAGVRRGDGRGPADEHHPDHHLRHAAAAGGAPHRQLVLLLRLRLLRGGERYGVPVLGGGAGGVPESRRHGARDGGGPAGAGAALLGRGRRRRVRHPGRARQLARALGQGLQRLRPLLRARHGRRHRLPHRRLRQPRPPHAQHPHHPQELILLLATSIEKRKP